MRGEELSHKSSGQLTRVLVFIELEAINSKVLSKVSEGRTCRRQKLNDAVGGTGEIKRVISLL